MHADVPSALARAVHRMVDGFGHCPSDWARHAINAITGDNTAFVPLWGKVFLPTGVDARKIAALLRPMVPTDAAGLIEFAEENDIDLDTNEMKLLALAATGNERQREVNRIRADIIEAWDQKGETDTALFYSGWQHVGDTGLLARDIDGQLTIGINAAGCDFFAAYWLPLYKALGYTWHEEG